MRVSQAFGLGQTQSTLDFIDVDVINDTPLFVDPWALRHLPTAWGNQCVELLQDFFGTVLGHVAAEQHDAAKELLAQLTEPNEVRLGLSTARARGRGLGPYLVDEIYDRFKGSQAVRTGLLQDLEDTLLFVDGIGPDIVSDITINIIRGLLIEFTQSVSAVFGIPLTENVSSGVTWAANTHTWTPSRYVALPVSGYGKHILVPKTIVRRRMQYDTNEYYSHFILDQLQAAELEANSQLVKLLKNGKRVVYKKDLEQRHPRTKQTLLEQTIRDPGILDTYRAQKKLTPLVLPTHSELAASTGVPAPNWDALLANTLRIAPGTAGADDYEKCVAALLAALFYPSLVEPKRQTRIHDGRKRIDISFTNIARDGFWGWLGAHYACPQIFVECKNYEGEVANPEIDQLSGRFSPRRGQIGLLVCRHFDDKLRFLQRCRDTADDDRGFIISLDDTDLRALVDEAKANEYPPGRLLRERFDRLIN